MRLKSGRWGWRKSLKWAAFEVGRLILLFLHFIQEGHNRLLLDRATGWRMVGHGLMTAVCVLLGDTVGHCSIGVLLQA